MKKERFFLVGMLAIALVFGLTVSGCGGDGFDPESRIADVPAITALSSTYRNYTPITADDNLEEVLEFITDEIGVLAEGVSIPGGFLNIQALSSNARYVINEDLSDYFSATGLKIKGRINGNIDETKGTGKVSVNFDADISDIYSYSDKSVVQGNIKGSGSVNMTQSGGSASFSYTCALIFAIKDGAYKNKYVRCVADVSMKVNISTESGEINADVWVYGDKNTSLKHDSIREKFPK